MEICPGRESHSSFAMGDVFTPLPAVTGPIVVNIGDMLSKSLGNIVISLTRQWLGLMTD